MLKIGDLARVFQTIDPENGDGVEVCKGLVVDLVSDHDDDPGVVKILDDLGRMQMIDLDESLSVLSYTPEGDIKRKNVYHVEIVSELDERG